MRKRHAGCANGTTGQAKKGLAAAVLGVACLFAARPVCAVEQWKPFLDRLHEQGLDDLGPVYLEAIQAGPLCPKDLRESFDYQMGRALVRASQRVWNPADRARTLDEAQARFKRFLEQHPKHPLAVDARGQLGVVLLGRCEMLARQAERPTTSDAQREQLLAQAVKFCDEARPAYEGVEKHYAAVLSKMPRGKLDPAETKLAEERDEARNALVQAKLSLAILGYQKAMLLPANDRQRKKLLTRTAEACAEHYDKYAADPDRPAVIGGLRAAPWEARCHFALGRHAKALEVLQENVLDVVAEEEQSGRGLPPLLQSLKSEALALAMEIAVAPKVARFDEAIAAFHQWTPVSRNLVSDSTSAAICYFAGVAHAEAAKKLRKDKDGLRRSELRDTARTLLEQVARFPGDHQQDAKVKLADPFFGKHEAGLPEPANFAEARQRAQTAQDRMQAAEVQAGLDEEKGRTKDLQRRRREMAQYRDEAIKYLRLALEMRAPDTPIDDVNAVRYYLALLHRNQDDHYGSAVLGEFLARRYPNSIGGRSGAAIALSAYARLHNQADGDAPRQFANRRLTETAELVTRQWPDSTEAGDAWVTLVQMALGRNDLAAARACVQRLPVKTAGRGRCLLLLGQAVWNEYLRAQAAAQAAKPSGKSAVEPPGANPSDANPSDATLDEARRLLSEGLAQLAPSDAIDETVFIAVYSLAQLELHDNRPAEAAKRIDDPRFGLLTLLRANHPATKREALAFQAYRVVLNVLAATGRMDQADQVMKAFESLAEALAKQDKNSTAESQVAQTYVQIGLLLQKQIQALSRQNKPHELKTLTQGLERILDRAAARPGGGTFNSLKWVAQSLAELGEAAASAGKKDEAEPYFRKAAGLYEAILKRMDADKGFAPDAARPGVQLGLARCLRHLGRHREALNLLVAMLQTNDRMLDAQVEAAAAFEDWGGMKGESKRYLTAIRGGVPATVDGQKVYLVWGWGKIAVTVYRLPKFADVFHRARYHLVLCRYRYALTLDADPRTETLRQAERDILEVQTRRPDMGGPEWRNQYDVLLRAIQKRLGKDPVGLGNAK